MQQEFGDARVFSAPIAEDYIVGTANGMCRFDPKIHVVIEGAEFADYFWPAVEQYVECTHEYWRSMVSLLPILHFALLRVDTLAVDCIIRRTLKGLLRLYPVPVLFVHRLPTMLPGCSAPVCVPRDSLFIWSPKRFTTQ